jgi:hypothetical protein
MKTRGLCFCDFLLFCCIFFLFPFCVVYVVCRDESCTWPRGTDLATGPCHNICGKQGATAGHTSPLVPVPGVGAGAGANARALSRALSCPSRCDVSFVMGFQRRRHFDPGCRDNGLQGLGEWEWLTIPDVHPGTGTCGEVREVDKHLLTRPTVFTAVPR